MNLNYDTDVAEFEALLATADKKLNAHNIAIDYDGEVIIDPEKHFPNVPTEKYKFCAHVKDMSLQSIDMVRALHKALLGIFEKDVFYMDNSDMRSIAA